MIDGTTKSFRLVIPIIHPLTAITVTDLSDDYTACLVVKTPEKLLHIQYSAYTAGTPVCLSIVAF